MSGCTDQYKAVWVGDFAAFFAIISLFPLIWYTVKTQKVRDLHMVWIITSIIANICWLYFSLINRIVPTIISSSVVLFMMLFILGMKIYVENKNLKRKSRNKNVQN